MVYRIDVSTAVTTLPAPTALGIPGYWINKNTNGVGTYIDATWLNMVDGETETFVSGVGIAPEKLDGGGALITDQMQQAARRYAASNVGVFAGSAALTPDNVGLALVDATAGNVAITLPAANAANGTPLRFLFERVDASSNSATIALAGADTLLPSAASLALLPGSDMELISDGTSKWYIRAPGNAASNGWQRIGRIILQWGSGVTTTGRLDAVTFPIAFPQACFSVQVGERNGAGWGASPVPGVYSTSNASTTGFLVSGANLHQDGTSSFGVGLAYDWMAIGA